MRRDLRWCQGNMQYWRFLLLPNLRPVSRYQLVLAILMFIGSPAWIGLLGLATIALVSCDDPATHHARRCRKRVAGVGARDVVLAEDRGRPRRPALAGGAPRVRRRGPVHRQFRHRNRLFDRAVSDPLDQSHDLSRWPAVQSRDQLDGAGPRRSRGALQAGARRICGRRRSWDAISLGLVLASQPWALPYVLSACRRAGPCRCRSRW